MTDWGPFSLAGKNTVVTGGAMGIGYGIAKRFVEAGAKVLIADLNGGSAQAASRELGTKAVAMEADVSKDAEAIVAKCVECFGSIDIFINNAAIYPFVTMLKASEEFVDKVLGVNLKGTMLCSKAAATRMIKQGTRGKIINIASGAALYPSGVGLCVYDTSKGGVVTFTKSFALEVTPKGILVNCILPGSIATEGAAALGKADALAKAVAAKVPTGRQGVPDDIAKVAVFLASSAADYMTGAVVLVDGGALIV